MTKIGQSSDNSTENYIGTTSDNDKVEGPQLPNEDDSNIQGFKEGQGDHWAPSDWQLSVSVPFLLSDNMAGFYRDGIYVTGLQNNGNGSYTMEAGGFSSAYGSPPLTASASFVRKRDSGDFFGEYESKGPSFNIDLGYQKYNFTDHGWNIYLDNSDLMDAFDATGDEIANQFNTDVPELEDGSYDINSYADELEAWANENKNGITNIPDIIESMFNGYDPSDDAISSRTISDIYPVHAFRADAKACLESSVWNYNKRVNAFNSGKVCLKGSALYFAGNHFGDNFYLGVGPYVEWTALTYHHRPIRGNQAGYSKDLPRAYTKPQLSVSAFVYGDIQYFNAVNIDEGFDYYNRFATANVGLGLRTTFPTSRRKNKPYRDERPDPLDNIAYGLGRLADDLVENPVDMDDVPMMFEDESR